MTIETKDNALQNSMNRGNQNEVGTHARKIRLGSVIRAVPTTLRRKVPVASSYELATLQNVFTHDAAPAATILRATARAGGVTGELTPQAFGATPTTGQIAVSPRGGIVVLAADAITDIDVLYMPEKVSVVELTLPVVPGTGVCVIPAQYTTSPAGVALLMEAEALAGSVTGKKIVLVPTNSAPATTKAVLNLAKTQVLFAVADAVTSARVKLGISSEVDVDAMLESDEGVL